MKTMMNELESLKQFEQFIQEGKITIFVFSADWCPDCLYIKPFMPKLMQKYNEYRFIYIDSDKFSEISKSLKIMGIPSFVAFTNGNEKSRFVSKLRKSEKEIDDFFNSLNK